MSGWTVVTLRARGGRDYDYCRWDNSDPAAALEDICATLDADSRVNQWTMDNPHAYAYLNCVRYDWDFAEAFLEDYQEMTRDAVVLGANDTTDTGTARYYPVLNSLRCTDEYEETQHEDGCYVGWIALAVINSRHGIIARDPFHDWLGKFDSRYADRGESRLDKND